MSATAPHLDPEATPTERRADALGGLLDVVAAEPGMVRVVAAARSGRLDQLDIVATGAMRPFVVAALASERAVGAGRPVVAVTATTREAENLVAALRDLVPAEQVALFPSWETLPHERMSPRSDTVGQRVAVLRRLAHPVAGDPEAGPLQVVVMPCRALLQPIVRGLGDLEPVRASAGDDLPMDDLVRQLVELGYSRTDLVEKRGQIAVRGGILDVFPPVAEHPLRLEFWGDTIEEVRWFKVTDQRSLEVAPQGLWAPPCRELLLTDVVRERARALAEVRPGLAEMLTAMAEGTAVEGMESLAPALVEGMDLVLDVLPEGTHVLVCDPERVRARAADLVATSQEFLDASWAVAASTAGAIGVDALPPTGTDAAPIDLEAAAYRTLADVREHAITTGRPWFTLSPFGLDEETVSADVEDAEVITIAATAADLYRGDTERVFTDVRAWLRDGWRVAVITEGHGPAERFAELFRDADIATRLADAAATPPLLATVPEPAVLHVANGCLDDGFVAVDARLVVLTEATLVGQKSSTKDMRRLPSRRRNVVDPLQLKTGDLVVHEQHGVGRYVEMVQRTVQGATREYLVVEYAAAKRGGPPDRLFIPTDQLDQVTRYVGGEAPALNRLGGSDWQKAKGRARKAVKQIAAELIQLYSARMAAPGHAFSPDTPWQRELEDAFPWVETPDQLACIDEVKRDMERPTPMDRLICGDVGYGKTEIAVRAAFKAVQDGKQVALLVPTTLLVNQHFSTFSERYAPFPVKVKALSRFQTDKEAKAVLAGVADGSVDVVIGTHRLLGKEVSFKDLGLVIVDEEQRFGVEHKEHLKALRADVDVLAMSATPIPRTLEMAVTGIREMSTIQTPPEERHPVHTFVGPYEEKQISAALRRELLRDGQVFYVHNRVESIDRVAARLRELVPEARVATAHGQMHERTLEGVIGDFWEKEIDVLVCTTIVESGIDIPNANTLLLDRADMFGLSQLHQLRGRVGRGRERAYAYFLYPPEKPLTETAHDRLTTIAQNTDLGAGMAVAMKDLEIRGAGNMLGGEQSGHIADVGFDLYIRLVGEAVAEFKGDGQAGGEPVVQVKVELPVDAHLPHDYVAEERLRLEAYRRIASVTTEDELVAVRAELLDRYGPPPPPVETLFEVASLRVLATSAGLTDITLAGKNIRFGPVALPESRALRLQRLHPGTLVKAAVRTILVPRPMTARIGGQPLRDVELLAWCREVVSNVLAP